MRQNLWWAFLCLLIASILIAVEGPTAATVTAAPALLATPVLTPAPLAAPSPAPQTWTRPADGAVMVAVPAGEFIMGSADGEGDDDEHPQHTVTLDVFWIDRTEVTNAQYGQCTAAGAGAKPAFWDDSAYNADDQPVVGVAWNDAMAYCAWAGARLPTEAEWEKAARGTDARTYPWGNEFDGSKLNFCDKNCEFDWRDANADDGYRRTAPVGSYPAGASPYGALDMAGSVWEWVADWYAADTYSGSPQQNPTGPDSGEYKVQRGGSWSHDHDYARGASRIGYRPDDRHPITGFRCCVSSTSSP